MNKFDAGVRLLIFSGLVQCAKYISAAIYMSGSASQGKVLFRNGLAYIGIRLDLISLAAFTAGALLLAIEIVGLLKDMRNKGERKENEEKND